MNTMHHPGRGRASGFSLVELMVALVVAGVLAAIAIPSYTQYILRSNRDVAKAALSENAQFMERYFTTNNTYVGAALPVSVIPRGASGTGVRYNLSFVADPTVDAFTIRAVPANAQSGESCGTLTLANTGAQGAGQASGCW